MLRCGRIYTTIASSTDAIRSNHILINTMRRYAFDWNKPVNIQNGLDGSIQTGFISKKEPAKSDDGPLGVGIRSGIMYG